MRSVTLSLLSLSLSLSLHRSLFTNIKTSNLFHSAININININIYISININIYIYINIAFLQERRLRTEPIPSAERCRLHGIQFQDGE
jgi:hypothetical protein